MTAELLWEQPPPRHNGPKYDWAEIGEALRSRPNEWAMVGVFLNQPTAGCTARNIREGKYGALGHGFDAKARTVDGQARVYARYTGEGGAS